jgi:hypothetical protein
MTAEAPKSLPSFRDLEEVMARSLKDAEPAASFRSLRLQPVVLPPPPTHETPEANALPPVSAQDDIEPDHSAEIKRARNLRLVMAGVLSVVTISAAFWAYQRSNIRQVAVVPEIKASPDVMSKTVVPPEAVAQTPVTSVPVPVPPVSADASMGQVSTELVAPTTDGLSPARRITTIRILVENDKEVRALR